MCDRQIFKKNRKVSSDSQSQFVRCHGPLVRQEEVHTSLLIVTFLRDRPTFVLYSPVTFLQELFLHTHSVSKSLLSDMVMPTIKHNMNVSFSGCGFLGIYHIGVASCLKTYAPYLLENKLCGSSAGAISACCLLCDIPLGKCRCGFDRNVFKQRFFYRLLKIRSIISIYSHKYNTCTYICMSHYSCFAF